MQKNILGSHPHPRLRVVAFPISDKNNNVLDNLYSRLPDNGIDAVDLRSAAAFGKKADFLHIHWPEVFFFKQSGLRPLVKRIWFLSAAGYLMARGAKLVYTVHNIAPHEACSPFWRGLIERQILARVSVCHHFFTDSIAMLKERLPFIRGVHTVIPHPLYAPLPSSHSRADLRAQHDIPAGATLILSVGQIRRYKRIRELVADFKKLPLQDAVLMIAGRCNDADYLREITEEIGGDARIRLVNRFLSEQEMADLIHMADLLAINNKDLHNSGVAILSLSYERPFVAPNGGAIAYLKEVAGPGWIYHDLETGVNDIKIPARTASHASLSGMSAASVSQKFADYLRAYKEGKITST